MIPLFHRVRRLVRPETPARCQSGPTRCPRQLAVEVLDDRLVLSSFGFNGPIDVEFASMHSHGGTGCDLEYAFTTLDHPGSTFTAATNITAPGQVVGIYEAGGPSRGFLLNRDAFTLIDFPGATSTNANGVNAAGQVVGAYRVGSRTHGFLHDDGVYTSFDVPGSTFTNARAINNRGEIVGRYDADGKQHGYLLSGTVITSIDFPGASGTVARGLNNHGDIVGFYTAGGTTHGFVLSGGVYAAIDVPGSTSTQLNGINDSGAIVGRYTAGGVTHAFLLSGGVYIALDPPGSTFSNADGINASGQIAGWYVDAAGATHGFLTDRNREVQCNQALVVNEDKLSHVNIDYRVLGWFVHPTPWHDSEFTTPGNQGEQKPMVTVLADEIGHLLGHLHEFDSLLAECLAGRARLTPGGLVASDELFASDSLLELWALDLPLPKRWYAG